MPRHLPAFLSLFAVAVPNAGADEACRVVDAVRAKLGMPNLKVVPVPVTSFSRILMLMTGSVDLECGSTTNTRSAHVTMLKKIAAYTVP